MKHKIIFLDCDGVLNRAQLSDMRYFVPECFKQFQRIVASTKANVVISSTWRYFTDWYAMLRDFLGAIDIQVVGKTDAMLDAGKEKEIKRYLNKHQDEILNYVVLDDIDLLESFPGHMVRTCAPGRIGLDKDFADKAIAILNSKGAEK